MRDVSVIRVDGLLQRSILLLMVINTNALCVKVSTPVESDNRNIYISSALTV